MRVMRLDAATGKFVDLVADAHYVQLETEAGLSVNVIERPHERRVEVSIDNRRGRLDAQEVTATDTQVRLKVAAVDAPAGYALADVTRHLKELEWVGRRREDGTAFAQCPDCGRLREEQHAPGCWLGAFLGQPSSQIPGGHK